MWDAIDTCYGTVANDRERGRRGEVVRLMRQTGASADEIVAVVEAARRDPDDYVRRMAGTDTALANNWSRLLASMSHRTNGAKEGQGARILREAAALAREGR